MLHNNKSWRWNNSVWIWKMMVDKTGELHKAAIRICFQIGVLKILVIFTGKHLCWSLFLIKLQAWGLQQRCFPVNTAKIFKNSFFYRTPPLAAFDYSNQSKIFQEITASKLQGQHATQFSRYEGLCPVTKTEIHWLFQWNFAKF